MKASVCYRALVLALLAMPNAYARPELVMPDVDVRRLDALRDLPGLAYLAGDLGHHRLERVDERVFVDPMRGTVSATVSATLTAGEGGLSALLMLIDAGLLIERISTDQGDVPFGELAQDGYRYVQPTFSPALPEGTQVTLQFEYAGTLMCPSDGRFSSCDFGGRGIDFAMAGTAFPIFYDPSDYDTTPYYERRLNLSVPSGVNQYVAADELERRDDGTTLTVDWQIPVRQDFAAYVAVFGDLVVRDVPGTSIPTQVLYLASDPAWVDDIVGWAEHIVAFLDRQAGRPFPFSRLTLVKLPDTALFPGTAGYATSLLAEYYGDSGARYFEETFAHETSHCWWGVLAVEQATNTRFLTEGLATFSQIDYTGDVILKVEDRDRYLGRRYNEMKLVSLYSTAFAGLPPVVPPAGAAGAGGAYTEWAYLKSAGTLDLLRVTVGDGAFAAGLIAYAGRCAGVPCTTADFASSMSDAAGQDLGWFFDQYVYANTEPVVTIDFTQTEISIHQTGAARNILELWLELEDGTVQKERVTIEGSDAVLPVSAPKTILRVRPNPRYQTFFTFLSANERDVDFDGEIDGADLIRCAQHVGQRALLTGIGDGVLTGNLDFEVRCDLTKNAVIDQNDMRELAMHFPEVRE